MECAAAFCTKLSAKAQRSQQSLMKPAMKPLFLAFLVLPSVLLVGCNLRRSSAGSTGSNPGSGPGAGPTTKSISVTVIGLIGSGMVLEDNGSDDMPVLANGTFTFKTAVTATYSVTVKTQPASPTQTCTVTNGAGTATANITNVQINCGSSGLTLGGSVSGLIGSGLVLQNNGGDNFQVTGYGNVTFTFSVPITPAAT